VPREAFLAGLRILEARYRVVHGAGLFARAGYLAGDDRRRAAELNRYLRDPAIRGLVCARGGYGLMRILPDLDAAALRARPKVIVGFSDVTALLAWARVRGGVRSVHGPVVTQLASLRAADHERLFALLEGAALPRPYVQRLRPVRGGRARGRLVGGNLEVLSRLVGTPYWPSLRGTILFLEEVGERPYRLDRTLTQLTLARTLAGVAGVVVGDLVGCQEPGRTGPGAQAVVAERLGRLGVPVCLGLPVGHGRRNLALPVGARAVLDADAGTLEVLEGAVG
jgi:muramoyltetrapeptide carboxypeptidase